MSEATVTAEDLSLYALDLLEGEEAERVETVLRSSSEAREELSLIRGDLAAFALGTEQHTPPALTRQRLLKQVARERRVLPIESAVTRQTRPRTDQRNGPAQNDLAAAQSPTDVPRVTGMRDRQLSSETLDIAERVHAAASLNLAQDRGLGNGFSPEDFTQPEAPARDPRLGRARPLRNRSPRLGDARIANEHVSGAAEALFREEELPQDRYSPMPELSFTGYGKPQEESRANRFASLFGWVGWAAACGFAIATVFAVRQTFFLQDRIQRQAVTLSQTSAGAQRAQSVLQALQSSSSQRFALARTDTPPAPSGRIAYLPEHGTLVFQGNNLAELPPYKTYELWLIPAGEGRQPIPAGTFKPDPRGFAGVVVPDLPSGTIASNFGITIEDDGGSTTPTLPILLVGQQS